VTADRDLIMSGLRALMNYEVRRAHSGCQALDHPARAWTTGGPSPDWLPFSLRLTPARRTRRTSSPPSTYSSPNGSRCTPPSWRTFRRTTFQPTHGGCVRATSPGTKRTRFASPRRHPTTSRITAT
jgi:hypothetical protein